MKNAITNKHIKSKWLLYTILILSAVLMIYNCVVPTVFNIKYSLNESKYVPTFSEISNTNTSREYIGAVNNLYLSYINQHLNKSVPIENLTSYQNVRLYAGGMPFGVKFYTNGVVVVGFSDISSNGITLNPASDSGIMQQDIITHINRKAIKGSSELTSTIEKSNGNPIRLTVLRKGKAMEIVLVPKYSDEEGTYKSGMLVRDSGAGIGTVTFIIPENYYFGGLGHGICSSDTGELTSMREGTINNVLITGVKKGVSGTPGEVKGSFSGGKSGALISNTECGLFGKFQTLPSNTNKKLYSVKTKENIHDGDAYILCTLGDDGVAQYKVKISNIDRSQTSSKCFSVTVVDNDLLSRSGGIVQGMSGSPIIQDGYIIGAVTHVLVNNPAEGYGIFIENMLRTLNETS